MSAPPPRSGGTCAVGSEVARTDRVTSAELIRQASAPKVPLPQDVIAVILSWLSAGDLTAAHQVSRSLRILSDNAAEDAIARIEEDHHVDNDWRLRLERRAQERIRHVYDSYKKIWPVYFPGGGELPAPWQNPIPTPPPRLLLRSASDVPLSHCYADVSRTRSKKRDYATSNIGGGNDSSSSSASAAAAATNSSSTEKALRSVSSSAVSTATTASKHQLIHQLRALSSSAKPNSTKTGGVPNAGGGTEEATKPASLPANVPAPASAPPALSGLALKLSLRCLTAKDAARAMMVCPQWRNDLRDSQDVWREVVENMTSAAVVDAVARLGMDRSDRGAADDDDRTDAPPAVDFRRLAACLARGRTKPVNSETEEGLHFEMKEDLPDPQLRAEDLLLIAVVQRSVDPEPGAAREYEKVAAYFFSDCTSWLGGLSCDVSANDSERVATVGMNPLSEEAKHILDDERLFRWRNQWNAYRQEVLELRQEFDVVRSRQLRTPEPDSPMKHAAECAMMGTTKFYLRMHLFRRDNGRCVCFVDQEPVDHVIDDEDTFRHWGGFPTEDLPFQFASSRSGNIARGLVERRSVRNNNPFYLHVECSIEAILPSSGSLDEPEWLKAIRRDSESNERDPPVNWTATHEEEISQVSTFNFRVGYMDTFIEDFAFDSNSMNDFLLILEGLDWQ